MALEVIGTGLARTGTMSLKLALEQLGLGLCHHMTEVFPDRTESIPLWIEAKKGRPDWEAIFAGFRSAVDYPSCKFWRELMAYYPKAKLIHTMRDPEAWFNSTQATIFHPGSPALGGEGPFSEFFDIIASAYQGRMHDHDFLVDYFRKHTEEVLAAAPRDRLLVYETAQGWEPLCAFLGVPVPDTPFPRANSTEEFQERFMSGGPPPDAP